MGGEKIRLARKAVERALEMLHPDDRFSLVVYDNVVDVLMESAFCTADARREALRRLAQTTREVPPTSLRVGSAAASRSPAS